MPSPGRRGSRSDRRRAAPVARRRRAGRGSGRVVGVDRGEHLDAELLELLELERQARRRFEPTDESRRELRSSSSVERSSTERPSSAPRSGARSTQRPVLARPERLRRAADEPLGEEDRRQGGVGASGHGRSTHIQVDLSQHRTVDGTAALAPEQLGEDGHRPAGVPDVVDEQARGVGDRLGDLERAADVAGLLRAVLHLGLRRGVADLRQHRQVGEAELLGDPAGQRVHQLGRSAGRDRGHPLERRIGVLRAEQVGERVDELVGEDARGLVGLGSAGPSRRRPSGRAPTRRRAARGLAMRVPLGQLLAGLEDEGLAAQELLRRDDERHGRARTLRDSPVQRLQRPHGAAVGIVELAAERLHETARAVEVVAHRLLLVAALRGDLLDPGLVVGPGRERAPVLAAFALDRAVDLEVLQHALEPAAADVDRGPRSRCSGTQSAAVGRGARRLPRPARGRGTRCG